MKLSIEHVGKRFKNNAWGVKDFSLELNSGIVSIVGPKDAGKTTLVRMLTTITQPTTGTISYNDENIATNPNKMRVCLGYLPQRFGIFPNLTVADFLRQVAGSKAMGSKYAQKRIEQLLKQFGLYQHRHKALSELSVSERQTIGIVQALINDPAVLILDEPAAGLTPQQWQQVKKMLVQLAQDKIIIIATANASCISDLDGDVVFMSQGNESVHAHSHQLENVQYC